MIQGLKNEDLWTLVRRFDKVVFHVRSIQKPPLADLDMNIADDEEFSPEKLRSQLERFYIIVVVRIFAVWKHIVRLRSWKETRRTSTFLAVYIVAWLLESRFSDPHPQHWQFFVTTLALFAVLAWPGFVWRYFWRQPGI